MSAVVFLLVCFLSCSVSEDPQKQNVTAHPGDDVTLPCKAPNNVTKAVVQWIRSDLEKHVYMKIDGRLNTADQDPSYVDRTQLEDDEMKNGDLSLILKNVTNNDGGRYECRYKEERATEIKLIIHLNVRDPQEKQVTAKPGDEVTLPCEAPYYVNISAVQWIRSDLERYVYMKSDGHLDTADQDPSYVNRVQLKDDELSLILKNVNNKDEGTYECRSKGMKRRSKRSVIDGEPISIVYLKVTGRDPEGEDSGVILPVTLNAAALVVAVGLVGLAVLVIYKKLKGHSENNSDLPVDDPGVLQQLKENENRDKETSTDNE